MKNRLIFLILVFLAILPFKVIAKNSYNLHSISTKSDLQRIEKEIEKRWTKVKKNKKKFTPYSKKSKKEISEEFSKLKNFRKKLWYHHPDKPSASRRKDYLIAGKSRKKRKYNIASPHLPFAYNCASFNYNSSHILIHGHHFIAMQSPSINTLPAFFQLLVEKKVDILIRLKPEKEYLKHKLPFYWTNYLIEGLEYSFIQPEIYHNKTVLNKPAIPYFYIETWEDNKSIDVKELYNLVETVRKTYKAINKKGPIACHCAVGVGRTGTFIAAYVLADLLDRINSGKISIEEIVLKLSIQRPLMVSVTEQYSLLYEFVDYYLKQKRTY